MIKLFFKGSLVLWITFCGTTSYASEVLLEKPKPEIEKQKLETKVLFQLNDLNVNNDERKVICINDCYNKLNFKFPGCEMTDGERTNSVIKQLEKGTYEIDELKFEIYTIDDDTAERIAIALENNTKVETLEIKTNYMGYKGAEAFSKMLKKNKKLKKLVFTKNRIGNEGALLLLNALYGSKTLTEIDLAYNNNINEEGALKIEACLKDLLETTYRNNVKNMAKKRFWLSWVLAKETQKLMPTYDKLEEIWEKEGDKMVDKDSVDCIVS